MANSKSYPQDSIILLIWIITGFLFGYTKHYLNLPTSAIIWITQGLISILVISPLFAIIGSLIGNRIKRSARENRRAGLFVVL